MLYIAIEGNTMEVKSNSTLIIHHFDSMFDEGLQKLGKSLESMSEELIDFMIENKDNIDKVILTTFEDHILTEPEQFRISEMAYELNMNFEHITYAYGWSRDVIDEDCENYPESERDIKWIQATRGYSSDDDVLEIEEWHRELKGKNVVLTGAFDGECLNDLNTVLNFTGSNVNYYKPLCAGTGHSYEMKNHIQESDFIGRMDSIQDFFRDNDIETFFDIVPIIEEDGDFSIIEDIRELLTSFDDMFNESKDPFKYSYDFDDFDFKMDMGIEVGSMSADFDRFIIDNKIIEKTDNSISNILDKKESSILKKDDETTKKTKIKLAL